jgi:hypothetical protein
MTERPAGRDSVAARDEATLRWHAAIESGAQEELAAANSALGALMSNRVRNAKINDTTGLASVVTSVQSELDRYLGPARSEGEINERKLEQEVRQMGQRDPSLVQAVESTGKLLMRIQSLRGQGQLHDLSLEFIKDYPSRLISKAAEPFRQPPRTKG